MKIYSTFWLAGVAVAATLSGCTTTDSGVKGAVLAKLRSDPVVSGQRIAVDADGGVVTLKGNLDSREAKERALALARSTDGVTNVKDMIAVRIGAHSGDAPATGRSSAILAADHAISERVNDRLRDDPLVKARTIDVDTREGVVYLTGTVATEDERDQAIRLAHDTAGVREVEANIRVGA